MRNSVLCTVAELVTLCLCAPVAKSANVKIDTTSLPDATAGTAYAQALKATGGKMPYRWALTTGSLPAALTLSTAGTISGIPISPGTSSFTVMVAEQNGGTDTQPLSISVSPVPLIVLTTLLPAGAVGSDYSAPLSAAGGNGGNIWAVTAGALPAGLNLSAAGVISGAPTTAGTANFTATVKDSGGQAASRALSISIAAAPVTVTTASLPNGTVGTTYSATLAATGGTGGYTWAATAGALPAGLSLSTAGSITGTPTTAGTANFTATATDSSGHTGSKALAISIAAAPVTITTASLPNGTAGTAYSETLSASGGTGGYTWAVTAGALPAGLSLGTAGSITGTPTAAGSANFTTTVTDSSGHTASKALAISIAAAPVTITTASLPNGTAGTAYSDTLSASGGTGGYTWAVTAGALPTGLSLSTAGSITGTPTTAGTANFTASVTDNSGHNASKALAIAIAAAPITITTGSLPNGTVGTAYSQALAATGGTGGYTWAVTAGALPAGLSLSTAGSITGTPSAAGTANFTATVTDNSGHTASKPLAITIGAAPITITTGSLPNGTVGTAYSQSLAATGGTGGFTWAVTGGALPAGLSLGADGSITGTPTTAGTANFTATATDNSGHTASKPLAITIGAAPITITTGSLPNGTVGTAYSQALAATGGTGGFTWGVTGGALPAGLSLGTDGSISGTPTAAGTANFTATVTDSSRHTASKALAITIGAAPITITTGSLPNGTVGAAYSQALAATGGTGGFTWAVTGGALPAALSLGADGSISGTPTAAGTANFTATVTDSSGHTASKALAISIGAAPISITTGSLPNGTVGAAYSQALAATGGTGGFTWAVTGGALPAGLSLGADGSISGTPTAAGTANFTATVTDSSGHTASKALAISIGAAPLTITTASLPNGTAGAAYSQTLVATGGTGGFTWAVTGGALPGGLSLGADGSVSGTPTAAGTANFTATVTDSSGHTASKTLAITIGAAPITITTGSLPNGTVGVAYSQAVAATGGTGGFTWAVTGGALPAGLSLGADGSVSGTPTAAGTANFTATVTDSSGHTASKALAITIGAAPINITTGSLPNGTVGAAYSQALAATGGTGGFTWAVTGGALPTGLSLGVDGSISGTATAAGTANFTATVTDSSGHTASKALAISIGAAPLTITTASLPNGTAGTAYSQTLVATGGTGGFAWAVTGGALPAGLSLGVDGSVSGTPTTAGTANFTATVTDSSGHTASKALAITIGAGALTVTTAALPSGAVGVPYSQTFAATGGSGGYTWSMVAGTVPAGLNLSPTGAISGTPTAAGNANLTVQVKDSSGATAAKTVAVSIAPASVTITTQSLPAAEQGLPYSQPLAATGGSGSYTWSISGGALPAGLGLSASGGISGTPTGSTGTFAVQVADTSGGTALKTFTIAVAPGPSFPPQTTLAAGVVGAPYDTALTIAGGQAPYTFSAGSGQMPPGLTLSAAGHIAGTPTQTGTFSIGIQARDAAGAQTQATFTLPVVIGLTITTQPVLPGGSIGVAYQAALIAAGGTAPYTYSVTAGGLPAGLTFHPDGPITGTPTAAGSFQFTANVTDSSGAKATKDFTLVVAATLTITTAPTLSPAVLGASYTATLAANGGTPPFTWSITAGAVPAGVTFAAGTLTGTPTASGTFTFTAAVADSAGVTANKAFTLTVARGITLTTPSTLPDATAGDAYSLSLAAAGGQAPYSWRLTDGALPDGLSLNGASGTISGTASASGTFNFTVGVTDAAGLQTSQLLTLVVDLPSLPSLALAGVPSTLGALQQPSVDLTLAAPYPVAVTGRLNLVFTPANGMPDDPAVQFSSGGRSVAFTIPPNATHATFAGPLALQSGSVAGAIQFTVESLTAGAFALKPPSGPVATAQVASAAPLLRTVTITRGTDGFSVQVVGLSNTRELASATVRFVPSANSNVQTSQVTVPLSDAAGGWFASPGSAAYGGQFSLTLPFSVSGGTASLDSVSVVLTNKMGDSQAASAQY